LIKSLLFTIMLLGFLGSSHAFQEKIPVMEALNGEECSILKDNCEYYLCEETRRSCGQNGYLVSFGHRYCQKFLDTNEKKFTDEGQQWLSEVRTCLQERLREIPEKLSCRDLKRRAFAQHVPCYIETGYCHLPRKDRRRIQLLLMNAIFKKGIVENALKVMSACASMNNGVFPQFDNSWR